MQRVFSLLPGNYKKRKKFGKAGGKLKVMEKRKQNRKSAFGLQSLLLNSFHDVFGFSYKSKMNEPDCCVPEMFARLVRECEQSFVGG